MVWYPTDKPFLPFPTVFGSKKYSDNAANKHGLGEVWFPTAPRHNFHKGIRGLTGDHICGLPSQFMFGQVTPADPPTQYDADGIPTCCDREPPPVVISGAYPTAVVSSVQKPPATVTTGARPAVVLRQRHRPSATVTTGARPTVILRQRHRPAGTTVTGGAYPTATVEQYNTVAPVTGGAYPTATVEQYNTAVRVTGGAYPTATVWYGMQCVIPVDDPCAAVDGARNISCWWAANYQDNFYRKYPVIPGVEYQLEIDWLPILDFTWWLYSGSECTHLALLHTERTTSPVVRYRFTSSFPFVWLRIRQESMSTKGGYTGVFDLP